MSKEQVPRSSSFDDTESKLSPNERRIQKLFRRAGWKDLPTREARHQAIRDGFENLFIEALFEKKSPYKIHERYSKENKFFEIAIVKDTKTVAVKTTYDNPEAGLPNTIYSVVKETPRWRKNLVFQLVEYTHFQTTQTTPALHIGYYKGEGKATHVITDKI